MSDSGRPASHPDATVGDIGEFDLIERLAALLPAGRVVRGIGDDAAVLDLGGGDYTLATIDMCVEGVHFDRRLTEAEVIGRRAMAMNVSDIAAMGGYPTSALISLALPASCPVSFADGVYRGLAYEAALTHTGIVGGNVTRTPGPITIDVSLLGSVPKHEVVFRSGANPGDVLVVTGSLGQAAARRLALETGGERPDIVHLAEQLPPVPTARVAVARRLVAARIPHAMMDLSDGLAGDLRHLCRQSAVGASVLVDRLPVSAPTRALATHLETSVTALALSGGEDYELLIAMSPADVKRARSLASDVELTVIGTVVADPQYLTVITDSGERSVLPQDAWRHF